MNEAPPATPSPTARLEVSRSALLRDSRWEKELEQAELFVQRLEARRVARSADLALLRRNVGETLATSRSAMSVFYKLQPTRGPQTEKYFLISTLFDLNRHESAPGDFGETMKTVAERASDSFERRFLVLLDAQFDSLSDSFNGPAAGGGELAYRLRQMTRLAASKRVGINWPLLLADLCLWEHPRKPVQKKWAYNFYDYQPVTDDNGVTDKGENADAN